MTVRIARRALDDLRSDYAARLPEEACGLLLGRGNAITLAMPAANVAEDRRRRFEIDPAVLFSAHRAARSGGPDILGCYHSHPAGRALPSPADAARALDIGWIWLIIGKDGENAYRVVPGGVILGRFDACTLQQEG